MDDDQFANLDATALASLVRSGEVTPLELVDRAIARIERINPLLNAVVTPMYDLARSIAQGPLPDGPFRGVPFLLKDLLAAYAGVRMTSGTNLMQDLVPDHDSTLVQRLKRAGLVVLGKTNVPEFGILPSTESRLLGRCCNPWNLERSAGGSSGGSAAAVAARMVPMAHGSDGGGSIRIPAACCGIFGLKPTRARTSLAPDFGDIAGGLVVEHALTRSVRDSAALLDATMGPDLGDPYVAPPPARPYVQEVGVNPGKLRIAMMVESLTGVPVHEDSRAAVRDAALLCEFLGHHVVEVALPIDGMLASQAFAKVWTASTAGAVASTARFLGREVTAYDVEPLTWTLAQMGQQLGTGDYLVAVGDLQRIARDVEHAMKNYDVWLTPVLTEPPVPLGWFDSPLDDPMVGFFRAAAFAPFTPMANATGQPAMSVPLYWTAQGLPMGVQFLGRFGDEATLFRLAAQLEIARPWADRKPSLGAGV